MFHNGICADSRLTLILELLTETYLCNFDLAFLINRSTLMNKELDISGWEILLQLV